MLFISLLDHVVKIYFKTDVFGAVKTMQAAKKLGIERYIMLSSIFALQPEKWHIDGLDQLWITMLQNSLQITA